eukprot:323956_1
MGNWISETESLSIHHAYPEIFIDSGYVTKSQLILQFNSHHSDTNISYSVHNYLNHNKKLFDIIIGKNRQYIITDDRNTIIAILEQETLDKIIIQNRSKQPIAKIRSNYDCFGLTGIYKQSGYSGVNQQEIYTINGDFEHNHFDIKNEKHETISKISPIYGNRTNDKNFGVRICENMDIVIVVSICMAVNILTKDAENEITYGKMTNVHYTPMGMPYI